MNGKFELKIYELVTWRLRLGTEFKIYERTYEISIKMDTLSKTNAMNWLLISGCIPKIVKLIIAHKFLQ